MTERHLIKMAALGRRFQLGDLYNYHNDRILTDDGTLYRELSKALSTTPYDPVKLIFERSNKRECIGLDEHLRASIVTGLINKYRGASNYLNDRPNPAQATRTLVFQATSKKDKCSHSCFGENIRKLNKATHVVVGVTYGAQVYCVLTQDLVANQNFQDNLEKIEEHLSKLTIKMENALVDTKNCAEFENEFNEEARQQIRRIKCRLYADFQNETVLECDLFEAYSKCFQLITDVRIKGSAVPIKVLLCPLSTETGNIDFDLVARCCDIWGNLESIVVKAKTNQVDKNSRMSYLQFTDTIVAYMELLRKSLKSGVLDAREANSYTTLRKFVDIAENHQLFGLSPLKRWLCYKEAGLALMGKMSVTTGITFVPHGKELVGELVYTLDKKYSLVLIVPSFDKYTNGILKAMKDYMGTYSKLMPFEWVSEDSQPFYEDNGKRRQVLDKIWELERHVERNKHLDGQVRFFVTTGESNDSCSYSLYESDELLKNNLDRLPSPPTNLRMTGLTREDAKMSTIKLEWDYEFEEIPCYQFVVQFRLKYPSTNESWMEQKMSDSNETRISVERGAPIEIRVAARTCIGRSEFSDILDTESVIVPWKLTVADVFIHDHSQLIVEGTPNIYLLKTKENLIDGDLRWLDIGSPNAKSNHKIIILMGATDSGKSTLIDGMVNYILGVQWKDPFRFKCVRDDDDPQVQTNSVTAYTIHHQEGMAIPYSITIVDMPSYGDADGGLKRKDTITTNIRRFLSHKSNQIDQIHAACFVVPSNGNSYITEHPNILDHFFYIFAKDIKDSIRLLVMFGNHADSTVLDALRAAYGPERSPSLVDIKSHNFNCSLLFSSNNRSESNLGYEKLFWDRGQENFENFFTVLKGMDGKDLRSTRGVIKHLQNLEHLIENIEYNLQLCAVTREDIETCISKIEECDSKMKLVRESEMEKTEIRHETVRCAEGFVAYNCLTCRKTCENPKQASFFDKFRTKSCTSATCNCSESEHDYQQFEWRITEEIVREISREMKDIYDSNHWKKIEIGAQLKTSSDEFVRAQDFLLNLLHQLNVVSRLLKSTAMLSDAPSPVDYLKSWITSFDERVPLDYQQSARLHEIVDGLQETLLNEESVEL